MTICATDVAFLYLAKGRTPRKTGIRHNANISGLCSAHVIEFKDSRVELAAIEAVPSAQVGQNPLPVFGFIALLIYVPSSIVKRFIFLVMRAAVRTLTFLAVRVW